MIIPLSSVVSLCGQTCFVFLTGFRYLLSVVFSMVVCPWMETRVVVISILLTFGLYTIVLIGDVASEKASSEETNMIIICM